MQNRRGFIKNAARGGALLLAGGFPWDSLAVPKQQKLVILHTNDVHSRLDPFPADAGKFAGQGGAAARAALIRTVRQEEAHVLLLDAGDIFQGTPYFNFFKGEPELRVMTRMGYDAATMGNHEFDYGIEGFARQLPHAGFPFLVANYDFTGTVLEGRVRPYHVIRKGALKIGIYGLGIRLKGLVPDGAFAGVRYRDPVAVARATSGMLKTKKKCDMVICLSHLGYRYDSDRVSDRVIAAETAHTDLVIGGHTHTFLDHPDTIRNRSGGFTTVVQAGWGGVRMGRLDYTFDSKKNAKLLKAHSVIVSKQTRG